MMIYIPLFVFSLIWGGVAALQFEKATLRLEQNASDEDMEVVIEAKGGNEGLVKLTVIAPDGHTIVDVKAAELGLRHFGLESPEPKDIQRLKKAYPEGEYRFIGESTSGAKLYGKAQLQHTLLEPVSGIHIERGEITWAPAKDAVVYLVSVELMDGDLKFSATLPNSATSLKIPEGFLVPGKKYQVGIGAVSKNGNITFVETSL